MTTNCLPPYHYSQRAYLFPDDRPLRTQPCERLLHRHAVDELFVRNTQWTDETYFTLDGVLSIHNSHFCARFNPHSLLQM
jgi:hypothetical protein